VTPAEREAKWVRWPQGDAGDAVDFACDHAKEPIFFLNDWRSGRADEWPEYMRWLNVQRDGARAASVDTHAERQDRNGLGPKDG
jgi:hypothetical protein